jgi:hypothetical protein|tara:strand:+ start:143 stop:403 length:261 start_codon:yes stop_codon:yes gene_type:complete
LTVVTQYFCWNEQVTGVTEVTERRHVARKVVCFFPVWAKQMDDVVCDGWERMEKREHLVVSVGFCCWGMHLVWWKNGQSGTLEGLF